MSGIQRRNVNLLTTVRRDLGYSSEMVRANCGCALQTEQRRIRRELRSGESGPVNETIFLSLAKSCRNKRLILSKIETHF